jgi:prepilin signal peptidase PulO-like enzyme (type II secretory pathway)
MVELTTSVLFVCLYDAFYKSSAHNWFGNYPYDITLFFAHVMLVAILIACSVMDIELYLIDVRITWWGMAGAAVLWSFTPAIVLERVNFLPHRESSMMAGLIGAVLGFAIREYILYRRGSDLASDESAPEIPESPDTKVSTEPKIENSLKNIFGLIVFSFGSLGLVIWTILDSSHSLDWRLRGFAYILWAFIGIVIGLIPKRESDDQIVEEIEREKKNARKMAMREALGLTPILLGFIVGYFALGTWSETIYQFRIGVFAPVMGLSFALWGIFATAAFGWIIRIGFTLLFGKEAMGVGDIYILAVIGAVTGPLIAILGFFIGSVIGVFGILLLVLWKTYRALSYGPWISIGTLVCLIFHDPIVNYLKPIADVLKILFRQLVCK